MVTGLFSEGSGAGGCPGSGRSPVSRVLATHPNPAWRPKQPSLRPPIPATRHQTLPRAPPEPPRSLPVAPLIPNQRCYGEAPVGLWTCSQPSLRDLWPRLGIANRLAPVAQDQRSERVTRGAPRAACQNRSTELPGSPCIYQLERVLRGNSLASSGLLTGRS